jgi:FtsH-binding integral membrane protein
MKETGSFIGIAYLHLLGGLGLTALSSRYPVSSNPLAILIESLLSFAVLWVLLALEPGPEKYALATLFFVLLGQVLTKFVKKLEDQNTLDDVLITVAGVFLAMTAVGFYDNQNVIGFGGYLFAALVGLVVARILLILGILGGAPAKTTSSINTALSWFGTLLFTVYVAYDTQRLKEDARRAKKDYIDSSMGLFLDALNLFTNIGDLVE